MAISSEKAYSIKTRKPVVDEASLLTEEDKAEAVLAAKADCTTSRRACKNCVCGRAEVEKQAEAEGRLAELLSGNDDDRSGLSAPAGGCGNCSRGDAFRCAGCPNLGKPAWNVAEADNKVKLTLTDDI